MLKARTEHVYRGAGLASAAAEPRIQPDVDDLTPLRALTNDTL